MNCDYCSKPTNKLTQVPIENYKATVFLCNNCLKELGLTGQHKLLVVI